MTSKTIHLFDKFQKTSVAADDDEDSVCFMSSKYMVNGPWVYSLSQYDGGMTVDSY